LRCSHRDSGKDWFPRLDNKISSPHPVCGGCGAVKNIGDRGKKLGYYVNTLYEIKEYLEERKKGKITEAQVRLITKRLEKVEGFEDVYWFRRSTQKDIFVEAVNRYTGLSPSFIESFLAS